MYRQPIKIFFLHISDTFGGAERTTYNLVKNINSEVFKITLVTSKKLSPYFSNVPCESIIWSEDIGMDISFGNSSQLSKDVKILSHLLNNNQYDLAFGMMHNASSLLACVKKIYHLNTKIVSSPRGPLSVYLNTCITSKEEKAFYKTLFSLFCRFSEGLIVSSAGVKDECVFNFGAKSEKVTVIHNSVDLAVIQQKIAEKVRFSFPDYFFLLSTACRLSQDKNLPFLIKAFSEIRKDLKVKLLIIGDGPEKTNLQVLCKSLAIEDDVCFVGFQENPFKYIAASDLFVHTCLFEGFGNAIIEAMACKVPVIATDCPYGPREIIQNGENGMLVGMNDTHGMAKAISTILQNTRIGNKLSRNGFNTASKYSDVEMAKAYEEFFLKIMRK
jgi:glycosyltransferase involved in cell wall biosynthesis